MNKSTNPSKTKPIPRLRLDHDEADLALSKSTGSRDVYWFVKDRVYTAICDEGYLTLDVVPFEAAVNMALTSLQEDGFTVERISRKWLQHAHAYGEKFPIPAEGIDGVADDETTPAYWKCKCPTGAIHPTAVFSKCPPCGEEATLDNPALVAEVLAMGYLLP
jgi:hypothetical protein